MNNPLSNEPGGSQREGASVAAPARNGWLSGIVRRLLGPSPDAPQIPTAGTEPDIPVQVLVGESDLAAPLLDMAPGIAMGEPQVSVITSGHHADPAQPEVVRLTIDGARILGIEFFDSLPAPATQRPDRFVGHEPDETSVRRLSVCLPFCKTVLLVMGTQEFLLKPMPPKRLMAVWNYSSQHSSFGYDLRIPQGPHYPRRLKCLGLTLLFDQELGLIHQLDEPADFRRRDLISVEDLPRVLHELEKAGVDPYGKYDRNAFPLPCRGRVSADFTLEHARIKSGSGFDVVPCLRLRVCYGRAKVSSWLAQEDRSLAATDEGLFFVERDRAAEAAILGLISDAGFLRCQPFEEELDEADEFSIRNLYPLFALPVIHGRRVSYRGACDILRLKLRVSGWMSTFEEISEDERRIRQVQKLKHSLIWNQNAAPLTLKCLAHVDGVDIDVTQALVRHPGLNSLDTDSEPDLPLVLELSPTDHLWLQKSLLDETLRMMLQAMSKGSSGVRDSYLTMMGKVIDAIAAKGDFPRALEMQQAVNAALPPVLAVEIPAGLPSPLKEHQRAGLNWLAWLCQCGFGGVLGDAAGLGKTLQVIACLLYLKRMGRLSKPVLVLCPPVALKHWINEFKKWAPELSYYHQPAAHRAQYRSGRDITLATFGRLQRAETDYRIGANPFHATDWGIVILDEAHEILTSGNAKARAVDELKRDQTIALTGTPNRGDNSELHALFAMTTPGLFTTGAGFDRLFLPAAGSVISDGARQLLSERQRPFLLRRTKKEVGEDLPALSIQDQQVPLDVRTAEEYGIHQRKALHEVESAIRRGALRSSMLEVFNSMTRLRRTCLNPDLARNAVSPEDYLSPKEEVLLKLIGQCRAVGRKTLIFTEQSAMVKRLGQVFTRHSIPHFEIHGGVTSRQGRVNKFQLDDSAAMILTPRTGGVALTITAATLVIVLDPWLNLEREFQSISRSHRLGQSQPVHALRLLATGTLENRINDLLQAHRTRGTDDNDVVFTEAGLIRSLTESQIQDLFSPLTGSAEISAGLGPTQQLSQFAPPQDDGAAEVKPLPRRRGRPRATAYKDFDPSDIS